MTRSPDGPASSKNNDSKSASSRNNDSKPVSGKNNSNGKINGFDISGNDAEHIKESGKSKSKKMSKSQNLAKSGKKMSKSWNWTNLNAIEARPKFFTLDTRTAFDCLWLAFTKAPKCHILIEIDTLDYAIGRMLSQLTSGTSFNEVIIKTDMGQ